MLVLVTGGAGFIGGHIVERLLADGHDVRVLDNFAANYDPVLKRRTVDECREMAERNGCEFEVLEGDIRESDTVNEGMRDVEFVYHQAASAGVRASVRNPRQFDEVNVDGTLNVLDAARNTNLRRLVLASSSSVYGKPRYLPYDEEHPTTPISPYGASKLAAERYAFAYSRVYDIPVVALRYFTVYGPRMRPNMAISNFVSRCVNDESPVVYGSGDQTRDFTYIDDVVRANITLLSTSAADGEVLNIGSTDNITITELAETIRDRLSPALELEYDNRHDADAEHTHADVSKASDLIDYTPKVSIREGVDRYVDWYLESRDWYEPIVRQANSA